MAKIGVHFLGPLGRVDKNNGALNS